jgi:hypothetical protein
MQQASIQGWTVKVWHTQVTQEDIVALGLKLRQCGGPIGRRIHRIAIPTQELGQPADKARFIINHQNPHRRGEGLRPGTQGSRHSCPRL